MFPTLIIGTIIGWIGTLAGGVAGAGFITVANVGKTVTGGVSYSLVVPEFFTRGLTDEQFNATMEKGGNRTKMGGCSALLNISLTGIE